MKNSGPEKGQVSTAEAVAGKSGGKGKAAPGKGKAGGAARPTSSSSSGPAKSKGASQTAAVSSPSRSENGSSNGDRVVPEKPFKLRKTRLKPHELDEFRTMLLQKRAEILGDMTGLQSEARVASEGESSSTSAMPIHMADLGSDTWEQELTLSFLENDRTLIREIDEALARIQDQTYGICLGMNKPITKTRLRAKPWAKYCIEYARRREMGLA